MVCAASYSADAARVGKTAWAARRTVRLSPSNCSRRTGDPMPTAAPGSMPDAAQVMALSRSLVGGATGGWACPRSLLLAKQDQLSRVSPAVLGIVEIPAVRAALLRLEQTSSQTPESPDRCVGLQASVCSGDRPPLVSSGMRHSRPRPLSASDRPASGRLVCDCYGGGPRSSSVT